MKLLFPGSPDEKGTLTRYDQGKTRNRDACKSGRWKHGLCNFGVADLSEITQSKALFANMFDLELDSIAFRCMEIWFKKQRNASHSSFDIDFYRNQKWVTNHV